MFTTRLELYLAIALALVLALGGFYLYAHHQGAQSCAKADTVVGAKAEVQNAHVEASGHIAQAKEDSDREKALAAPIAPTPTVGLQPAAVASRRCPVPAPGPAAGASQPAADVRATGAASLVLEDADSFIRESVQRARNADTEIRDRDELLRERDKVCRGQLIPQPKDSTP